jgi:hypothetical protein
MASDVSSAVIGAVAALVGAFVGGGLQIWQARRSHNAQQADLLRDTKRLVYTEYLRSISAGFAIAELLSAGRSEDAKLRSELASEEAKLRAATAGIKLLSGSKVSDPAGDLTERVVPLHREIAKGMAEEEKKKQVDDGADKERLNLIDLFKKDLGIHDDDRTGVRTLPA